MPINEYDAIASDLVKKGDLPGSPLVANEYDSIVKDQQDATKNSLQQAMVVAAQREPDRHASVLDLARKSLIPADVVDRQFEKVQRQQKSVIDYDSVVKDSPAVAQWLSNPDNASVASDDVDNLKNVEKTVRDHSFLSDAYDAVNVGISRIGSNVSRVPGLINDLAQSSAFRPRPPVLEQKTPELSAATESIKKGVSQELMYNPVAVAFDDRAKEFHVPDLDTSITNEIGKGNYSGAGRALALQFMANAPNQAAIIAGSLVNPALGIGFAGVTTAAGQNKVATESGVSKDTALLNAVTHGTVEATFERLGTFGILKTWEKAIAKQYGKEVSRQVYKDFAKTLTYSVIAEGNEEAMTSIAQDLSDYITDVNPQALEGIGNRALDAGIIGGFSGGGMTAPAGISSALQHQAKIRQTNMAKDFYLSMGKTLEATKIRKRLPEAAKTLVEEITKGGPVENVYIPVESVDAYFQGERGNAAQAMTELGVLKSYEEAKATGGNVQVPLSTWAEKVVGTPHHEALADHIKFNESAQTVTELNQERETVRAKAEAEVKAAEDVKQAEKNEQIDLAAAEVGGNIQEQLKRAGFDEKTAGTYGQVYESAFRSFAERTGVDPQELFKKYGLTIERKQKPEGGARALLQKAKDTIFGAPETALDQIKFAKEDEVDLNHPLPESVRISRADDHLPVSIASNNEALNSTRAIAQTGDFTNKQTGITVKVDNDSIKKIVSQGIKFVKKRASGAFRERLEATQYLGQLIENGVFLTKSGDAKGRGGEWFNVFAPLQIGDQIHQVKLQIKKEGDTYRLHNIATLKAGEVGTQDPTGTPVTPTDAQNIADFTAQIKSLRDQKAFFQGENDGVRGRITFGKNRKFKIDLFEAADLSTFLHETGHFYMEVLADLATSENANDQLKADYKAVLEWLGVESRDQINVEHHEQWARAFEAYLMKGEAPSNALREAFSRFKAWLISVYKRIQNLDVTITPEIHEVMNRLLATDEEIAAAFNGQLPPMDLEAFGLTGKKAERYVKATSEARRGAEDILTAKLMGDVARKQRQEYKVAREKIREEVELDVNDQKIYKVMAFLAKGKNPDGTELPSGTKTFKLNRGDLVEVFTKEILSKLPRGSFHNDGIHHTVVADYFGFNSGEEMVRAIAEAPDRNAEIDRITDERMAEEYPDLVGPAEVPEEAIKALHNDKATELKRLELEILAVEDLPVLKDMIRQVARKPPRQEIIREQANRILAKKAVRDLRPDRFMLAEAKARKQAGEALARGDRQAAYEAKLRELLNHELYKASLEAREIVSRSVKKFKTMWKNDGDVAKTRDMDLVNAARATLSMIGIGKANKAPAAYLEQMKSYDPDTYQTMVSLIEAATATVGLYKDLTVSDFMQIKSAVDAMWDLAKTVRQMEIDGKAIDREKVVEELQAQVEAVSEPKARLGYERAVTDAEKRNIGLLGVKAALTRVEHWATRMDLGARGVFTKYFINPIMEATARFRLAKKERLQKFKEIIEPLKSDLVLKDIAAPEIGYTFSGKAELLGALLHTGNESNLQKLLIGRQWGEFDAADELYTGRWDRFIDRLVAEGTLTKRDFETLQKIWDQLEEIKPDAQKAHKKMYGHYFSEITANAFTISFPDGTSQTFRGGYVPAMTDSYMVEDAQIRADQAALEQGGNSFMFPTTGRGFTKSRVSQYNKPLVMDLHLIPIHLDKILRFVHLDPTVRDVARVVNDQSFRETLGRFDPTLASEMLTPWLQRVAQQRTRVPSQGKGGALADGVLSFMRKSASLQLMALNFINALQNFTALSPASLRVGYSRLMSAQWEVLKSPKQTAADIAAKSEFMSTQLGTQAYDIQQEIDDIIVNPTKYQRGKEWVNKHARIFQVATQNLTDLTVWTAAYNQAIEKGADEKEAVRAADAIVRQTGNAQSPESVSAFESGSALKQALTMFYGYFNNQANLLGAEIAIARDLKKSAAVAFHAYLLVVMAPAVLSALIARGMGGGLDDDKDGEFTDDMLDIFVMSQLRYLAAMVPGGSILNGFINAYNDKAFDDRITVSPVVSIIERSVKGVTTTIPRAISGKGKPSTGIKDALTAIGFITGTPGGAVARPLGYVADVAAGETKPTGPIDFARGLVTGKPGGRK